MGPGFESLIVHQKMLISHRNGHFFYPFYPIFVSFVHFYPPFGGYFLLFSSFWGINWGIKSASFSLDFSSVFNMHTTIFSLHKANIHPINHCKCRSIYFLSVLRNNLLPLPRHRILRISYRMLFASHNKYDLVKPH